MNLRGLLVSSSNNLANCFGSIRKIYGKGSSTSASDSPLTTANAPRATANPRKNESAGRFPPHFLAHHACAAARRERSIDAGYQHACRIMAMKSVESDESAYDPCAARSPSPDASRPIRHKAYHDVP
jgi:hypothetical protein